jgi:hypothetical protein
MNKNNADTPNIASPALWQGTLTRFYVPLRPKPQTPDRDLRVRIRFHRPRRADEDL